MVRRTHKIGLDANRPIVTEPGPRQGALSDTVADPQAIGDSGAAWVRINFVLGPWSGPGDPSRYQGHTWAQAYTIIIDQFLGSGLSIYGLIGHEAVKTSPGFFRDSRRQTPSHDAAQAQRWIADYAANFGDIVKLFHGKVNLFESFNEPDDWHGGHQHWIHPTWFAEMLQAIHRQVRLELGLGDVNLISGPLQGLEANDNRLPTQYLRDTYQYGRQYLGWGQPDRPYPFDGVGYHLYLKEGFNPDWEDQQYQVRHTYRRYIDEVKRVIRAAEGPTSSKQLYISEIGWPSNRDTPEDREFQARNLSLALELMANDPAVAVGIWFCTEDFAPGQKHYGLYLRKMVNPGGSKPSFDHFRTFCERFGLGVVRGVLRDRDGRPQSGYQIQLGGPNIAASTTSDNQGVYGFESLPAGTHTVSVVGTDVTESVYSDGRATVTLDLTLPFDSVPTESVIRGVLRDQAGTPQAGFRITLTGPDVSASVTTDSSGFYRFDGLLAGTYIITVVGTGLTKTFYLNGQAPVTLDLTLPSAPSPDEGIISGVLRDQAGAPQAGHQITLVGSRLSRSVATDGDGGYRFDGLSADTYSVSVVDTDLTQSIYSDGHRPITLHLTLPSPPLPNLGVITGMLRDDAGAPWTDREITLTLLGANLVRSVVTDDDGAYRLDGLPAGTYTVSVVGTDLVRPVWSDGKAHITIDLTLQPTVVARVDLGIISGVLRDQTGMPQSGRRMSLMGPSLSRFIITDSSGAFQFDGLPAGTSVLTVDGTDLSRHVWSDGQAPVTLDLTIQPAT